MRPIFCTVIENQTAWVNAASLLIRSLRQNGSPFAESPFVVLVNGYWSSYQYLWKVRAERVTVLSNHRHQGLPHLSKVGALGLSAIIPFTHLILLDHDTLVLRLEDLGTFLTNEFHARRNYKHSLRKSLGADYATHLVSGPKPWTQVAYFNSGVVVVPQAQCLSLSASWEKWGERLLTPYNGKPLSEQVGLAMAVAESCTRYRFLPMTYNETNWRPPSGQARIIHYNAYDPVNKEVKRSALLSYDLFRSFLAGTTNRFWRAHAASVECLLDDWLISFSRRLNARLEPYRLCSGSTP
jgi:hypothetical protein